MTRRHNKTTLFLSPNWFLGRAYPRNYPTRADGSRWSLFSEKRIHRMPDSFFLLLEARELLELRSQEASLRPPLLGLSVLPSLPFCLRTAQPQPGQEEAAVLHVASLLTWKHRSTLCFQLEGLVQDRSTIKVSMQISVYVQKDKRTCFRIESCPRHERKD